MKNTILTFDVNETLLNLDGLKIKFKKYFNDENLLSEWFGSVINSAFLCTIVNEQIDFSEVGKKMLISMAEKYNQNLKNDEVIEIITTMRNLDPHNDVVESLDLLKNNKFKMIALTNSNIESAKQQLTNSKIIDYFDQVISVEEFNALKPSSKVYLEASNRMKCSISSMRMIACHAWDLIGASKSGMKVAYVQRTGQYWNPIFSKPEIFENNLIDLAKKIIERDS